MDDKVDFKGGKLGNDDEYDIVEKVTELPIGEVVSIFKKRKLKPLKIEVLGTDAESIVIKEIAKGTYNKDIAVILNHRFPGFNITFNDVGVYIQRNRRLTDLMIKYNEELAKKHAQLHMNCQEEIMKVFKLAEKSLVRLSEGNYDIAVMAGIKPILSAIMAYAKITGAFVQDHAPTIQVNVTEKVSEKYQNLRNKLMKAKFVEGEVKLDE